MNQKRETVLFLVIVIVGAVLLTGLTWLNYLYSTNEPGAADFIAPWMGAKYWLKDGISPYSDEVSQAIQQLVSGQAGVINQGNSASGFFYPLFSMVIFAPFGLLELTLAGAIWRTLLEISLVLAALFSIRLAGWKLKPLELGAVLAFSIFWYCGARTLLQGQFIGMGSVLILGALLCIKTKHDLEAGLLLALSLSKPEMSILLVFFALIWALSVHRTRLAGGIAAGFIFLMAVSLVFLPGWPLQWIQQFLDNLKGTGDPGSIITVVASFTPGISRTMSFVLGGVCVLYMVLEWVYAWGREEKQFIWASLLTLVIACFLTLPVTASNSVMLLPVFFGAFGIWQQKWGRRGQTLAWIVLIGLLPGLWALYILTTASNSESPFVAVFVPILALLFLWWTRGWSSRPAMLPFEKNQGY